jgi:hypothetical protein
MSEQMPDRTSPEYIEAVISKKPHGEDPKDIRIRNIIEDRFLQEDWARAAIGNIREEQITYLRDVIPRVDEPEYVDAATQEIVRRISSELHSTIEEGQENLGKISAGRPVMIMTNHLGTYKLTGINPQTEVNGSIERYDKYDFMYPYPLYFAALSPVAEALGDSLSYTSDDFPGVYGKVHSEAGFVHVPPASLVASGRTEALTAQTNEVFLRKPNTALVNFPEGGTSGKYNEAGPYDLLDFKTGGYVIAANLGIPVLHVAQYFDPHEGMRLKVFEPMDIQPTDREGYQELAAHAQAEMQAWLSGKEQSNGHMQAPAPVGAY